jgi:enoyl-CoA hydratase/carnithine racemase
MIDLKREGDVFILRMDHGENRFRAEFIEAWNSALDEVEGAEGPKALVTTGTGKFYSNGLDLEFAMAQQDFDFPAYLRGVLGVMQRVLTFPAYTVCAMNGHAFGAGAQLALAHDQRVMRADRGYWCMPEIDLKAPLHPGMTAIIQARLPIQVAHEVIVTGTRYGAERALAARIVDATASEDEVVPQAIALAAPFAAKADPVMRRLKADMYPQVLAAIRAEMA